MSSLSENVVLLPPWFTKIYLCHMYLEYGIDEMFKACWRNFVLTIDKDVPHIRVTLRTGDYLISVWLSRLDLHCCKLQCQYQGRRMAQTFGCYCRNEAYVSKVVVRCSKYEERFLQIYILGSHHMNMHLRCSLLSSANRRCTNGSLRVERDSKLGYLVLMMSVWAIIGINTILFMVKEQRIAQMRLRQWYTTFSK